MASYIFSCAVYCLPLHQYFMVIKVTPTTVTDHIPGSAARLVHPWDMILAYILARGNTCLSPLHHYAILVRYINFILSLLLLICSYQNVA